MPRYIDADELLKLYDMGTELEEYAAVLSVPIPVIRQNIKDMPTVNALEVTAEELRHLINDVIAYVWRLEDRGCDKPEFGYDSRKALLEKLKRFEKEHFPEHETEG